MLLVVAVVVMALAQVDTLLRGMGQAEDQLEIEATAVAGQHLDLGRQLLAHQGDNPLERGGIDQIGLSRGEDDGLPPLKDIVSRVEAAAIQDRLRRHGYHRTRTAHSLGVTREWLWAKMRRLGLFVRNPQEDDPGSPPPDGRPARRANDPTDDADES
jgi:DNA-binding NtrC family response regulator